MYGGSRKFGRGGGGSGGRGAKRIHSTFPRPPPPRPVPPSGAPSGRITIGASAATRNSHSGTASSSVQSAPEETFNLVNCDPLAFAMIIRLTPDLVDEIGRIEAQGSTTRIKFDSNANNPSGNVIDVGGKDFGFTWSHELGDLCDIYEERQSGEDGNGLLVESGGAWRKLNVQRILDETTKNHVKMRSEEAERKLKSRKAIVLDHENPSVKNQMQTSAAAAMDVNVRRMPFKAKKEPAFKKQKTEPNLGTSPSVLGIGNLTRCWTSVEEGIVPKVTSKGNTANSQKKMSNETVQSPVPFIAKKGLGASPTDLANMLITLLTEHPKGMSLKALEKSVGETIPNSARRIDPIIKKIATFKAPGRYTLKPGVTLDSFKKPSPESGSSPLWVCDQTSIPMKGTSEEFKQQFQLSPQFEKKNLVEMIDTFQNSPNQIGDKVSNHSEGPACSSSERGSDSDSESNSRSQSRSRSPVGSGSSGDSERDSPSSNKEGSDVDVAIMTTDDNKEECETKLQNLDPRHSSPLLSWRTLNAQPEQVGIDEDKQNGRVSVVIETVKGIPNDDHDTEMVVTTDSVVDKTNTRYLQEAMPFSPDYSQQKERQQLPYVQNFVVGRQNMKDASGFEHSYSSERISKSKSKIGSNLKYLEENFAAKRLKAGSLAQSQVSGRSRDFDFSQSPHYLSPDKPDQDLGKDQTLQMTDRVGRCGSADTSSRKGYDLAMSGRSFSDPQHSIRKSGDHGVHGNTPDVMEIPRKYVDNLGHDVKHFERSAIFLDESDGPALRSIHGNEKFPTREKVYEDGCAYEKSITKTVGQSAVRDKTSMLSNSHCIKQGEQVRKSKDKGQMTHTNLGSFPKNDCRTHMDKSSMVNGKGSFLTREPSDFDFGLLCEPTHREETQSVKKQVERNSFKLSENKLNASDSLNSNSSKGIIAGNTNQDSRNKSSPSSIFGVPSHQESLFRDRIAEDDIQDSMRSQQGIMISQACQFPIGDCTNSGVGFQLNELADMGIISRKNYLEGCGGTHEKAPVNLPQQYGTKCEGRTVGLNTMKETNFQKSNTVKDLKGGWKENFWMDSYNSGQNRGLPSSEEDNSCYSKYEKDAPELKGPIKNFSQYKEYVQEYHDKYSSYCLLNKNLDTYRNDFNKLGCDLELAKDMDMEIYFSILGKLKESYHLCGMRHKRLKKIFIVLHEELKYLKQRIYDFAALLSARD